MSKIKKCITKLLALAVVLSVVQIPAFAADKVYLQSAMNSLHGWDISVYNCWNSAYTPDYKEQDNDTWTKTAGCWLGNKDLMLGGQKAKAWMNFSYDQTIGKGTSFIVECMIKGTNGGEYVISLNTDKVTLSDGTFTKIGGDTTDGSKGLRDRLPGALVGNQWGEGLGYNTGDTDWLNQALKEADGTTAALPSEDWHKYKIYCDGSKYAEAPDLTVDVTVTVDGKIYQTYKKTMKDASQWTGVSFQNNSTGATSTKLAEFKDVKVYAPEPFVFPTFSSSVELKDNSSDAAVGETVAVGTPVKANMTVTNTVGMEGNAYLILAEYDKDGNLAKVEVKDVALTNRDNITDATTAITVSEVGGTVKAFLWTDKFRPLNSADTARITAE